MIETAIKEDLILDKKLIIPKNKLDAIRIMNELHLVVGGQPTHEKDQPNDNNPILDLACTLANIHASGVGEHADLRPIQNEPPSFFYGEGFISGIASLKGNGILAIFGHWHDGSGNYAIKQFYYTDKEISYRNATSEDKWGEWIDVLTSNSQLDYNKLLNVPITSKLSDDKNKIASIFSVNEVNRKANTAQIAANNADAKAVNAQRTADTGVANAKIADDKAGKAQSRADAAFTRVKPINEGGTGATTVANARLNLGLKSAALADLTSTLSDAKDIAASIFSVNEINRKVNMAQTTANNAYSLAQSKQDTLTFSGTGNVARMSEVNKKRDLANNDFSEVQIISHDATLSMGHGGKNIQVNITNNNTNNNFYFHDRISKRTIYLPITENSGTIALRSDLPGYYQQLVNMTSQRSPNVTYINNTSAPITIIVVSAMSANLQGNVTVDGVSVPYSGTGRVEGARTSIALLVPPKSSYSSNQFEWFYEVR